MIHRFNENCPCKNCSDRQYQCHGTCDKYANWKAKLDAANAELREKKDAANYDAHAALHTMRHVKKENIWKK